jgi:hypothetical protein
MPGQDLWQSLKVGDRVRIVRRPHNYDQLHPDARAAYDRFVSEGLVLKVTEVDEFGLPWVGHEWKLPGGGFEGHSLAINDDSGDRVSDDAAS